MFEIISPSAIVPHNASALLAPGRHQERHIRPRRPYSSLTLCAENTRPA